MQGLEAINAANGWAMALTGACIVMTGLATLSFIIAQLHRVIALIEKKETTDEPQPKSEPASAAVELSAADDDLLSDMEATAEIYQPLTAELGTTFELSQLYRLMETKKLPHPHITVRELRNTGHLVSSGEGSFTWKNS